MKTQTKLKKLIAKERKELREFRFQHASLSKELKRRLASRPRL